MKKNTKILLGCLAALILAALACGGSLYYYLFAPKFHLQETAYLYIDRDDSVDSIYNKVKASGETGNIVAFRWLAKHNHYAENIHTGRYAIHPEENVRQVFYRLFRRQQSPMNLTIGSVRTLDRLARSVGKQLMIDSAEVANALQDTLVQQRLGYTPQTLATLFIPDTYQVYWNMSVDDFIQRMQKEHQRFWNEERLKKAESIGMTSVEVCTLASIVAEETNNKAEKPLVAGLYINRLSKKMPLQADPTIKFALQDFTLRRILKKHLAYDSPYNTYKNIGLPPGPIRIASPVDIDAVLNHVTHNYLYMCAKEDFSGTHNFAATYSQHTSNARKYWNALNKRKIFN